MRRIAAALAQMLDRVGRADLEFDLAARSVVALGGDQRLAHAALDQVLKYARDLFGALLLVRADQDRHLLDIGPGVLRREIAAHPVPDRVEAGARDAAAMLALRRVVHQKRLERSEEQALRIAGPRQLAPRIAHIAAQLFEDLRRAGRRLAAQQRALEFCGQQRARLRLQLAQIFPQFLAGHRVGHAPPAPVYLWVELATGR